MKAPKLWVNATQIKVTELDNATNEEMMRQAIAVLEGKIKDFRAVRLGKATLLTPIGAEGEPCTHPGCSSHSTHPCEVCGKIAGEKPDIPRIPDLEQKISDMEGLLRDERTFATYLKEEMRKLLVIAKHLEPKRDAEKYTIATCQRLVNDPNV